MPINSLPLLTFGPQRIPFTEASSQLIAQALTDAQERLVRHLPTVSWATWRDTLCQLQLDVLVQENAVTFDWQALVRWVQELATSPERPAQDSSTQGTADAQLRAYRQQAVQALAELRATPNVVGPLLYALLTQLAQVPAVASLVAEAPPGAGAHPANQPSPPALELPFPAPSPAVESTAPGVAETGLIPPVPLLPPPNPPVRAPRRPVPRRRTFRAIVERHCRPNGKVGFTVRELCTTMRISAASLAHARVYPGHLSVEKVMALAEAMGECPLGVLLDLLSEAGTKKRRERKKRVSQR